MYNTFIPINHEIITMNIENTPYGLKLGSEYGEYLLIRNDIYTHVEYDKYGNSYIEKEASVEIHMSAFDEENVPSVSKTLTFAQLKALADFCNQRISDIEAGLVSVS